MVIYWSKVHVYGTATVKELKSSDLNPRKCVRWTEEKKQQRSWESEGSGVILDEGMVSDLFSGVL